MPAHALRRVLISSLICEQAHQQLKEELGLDHFEGRSWRGLHRHALMTSSREKVPSWRVDLSMVGPPDRRKQGPIQFLENNPIQSSFWVRFMCPKTRRNWLRLPNCKIPSGVELPPSSRPEAKPHPRPKAPAISARFMR